MARKQLKARLPMILILAGALLQLLLSFITTTLDALHITFLTLNTPIAGGEPFGLLVGIILTILSIILVIAAIKVYSMDNRQVKNWSAVSIILAIISVVLSGVLVLSTILIVIGGIVGLYNCRKASRAARSSS